MPPLDPRMMQETAGGQPMGAPTPDMLAEPGQEPAMPPAVGDQEEGITPASPEEQAQADHFVEKAVQLIYSDGMFEQVVQMLEGGGENGDPGRGLAMATDMIAGRVAQVAAEAGEQIAPDVAYHAFGNVFEELMEVARRGQIKDYSKDADAMESAWFQALDLYRERLQQSGAIDQESAQGDLDKLIELDKNGQLEKIIRDLAASDSAGQAGGPVPPPTKPKTKGFQTAMGG